MARKNLRNFINLFRAVAVDDAEAGPEVSEDIQLVYVADDLRQSSYIYGGGRWQRSSGCGRTRDRDSRVQGAPRARGAANHDDGGGARRRDRLARVDLRRGARNYRRREYAYRASDHRPARASSGSAFNLTKGNDPYSGDSRDCV